MLAIFTSVAAQAETSLWLVRPLYPGQEALVERAEKALDKLTPAAARKDVVIGTKELATALKAKKFDEVPCFSGDTRCADPIDQLAASLGFDRIVLIQGGQDESGYKFKVSAFEPATGKNMPASAANQNLEKALLGAVAKVVPVASTLEVKSIPPGATVFIDDVKVGVTPLSTQVLPGERMVKVDLKLHQPLEETVEIPIKGSVSISKTLEKVAARIMIAATPAGTEISIDGQFVAKDKVDRGILPGPHTIRLSATNYKAFEQTITVKADEQYNLDKSLEPVAGVVVDPAKPPKEVSNTGVVVVTPPTITQPPPRQLTESEKIMEKKSNFQGHFGVQVWGPAFIGTAIGGNNTSGDFFKEVVFNRIKNPARPLLGGFVEYGQYGENFGLQVIGLGFHMPIEKFTFGTGIIGSPTQTFPETATAGSLFVLTVAPVQPSLRFVFGKFLLAFQAGIEVQVAHGTAIEDSQNNLFQSRDKSIMSIALRASGRINLKYNLPSGFFVMLSGGGGLGIFNFYPGLNTGFDKTYDLKDSWSYGFSAGVGYAF